MRYSDVSSTYPPSLQHNAEIATVRGLRTFGQNKWSRRGRLSQKQAHPGQTTFSAAEEVQVPPEVLQEALKVLRKHIKHQEFITNQTFEPTMEQALELLSIVEQETHVWLGELAKRDESLYRVFLKPGSNECQLCGYLGKTLPRALGHVRSKMGHKPFTCENEGCQARTCSRTRTYVLLFRIDSPNRDSARPIAPDDSPLKQREMITRNDRLRKNVHIGMSCLGIITFVDHRTATQ